MAKEYADDEVTVAATAPSGGVALRGHDIGLSDDSPNIIPGNHPGMIEPGNIDLSNRPDTANPDGSHSSVRSMSFQDKRGGPEILVPTVHPSGRVMSDDEAIDYYHKTGEHLGKFKGVPYANAFADKLHRQQAGEFNSDFNKPVAKRVYSDDDVTVGPAPAKPAPNGRAMSFPADPSPPGVITTKPVKPMFDPTGNVASVQGEIRRGRPGEPLQAAEERAKATEEANNPIAKDWIAQELINGTVAGPVLGAVGGKVLGSAVARSAARPAGSVLSAVKEIPRAAMAGHGVQSMALEGLSHMAGLPHGAGIAARVAPKAIKAGAMAADEGLAMVGRKLGIGGSAVTPGASQPLPVSELGARELPPNEFDAVDTGPVKSATSELETNVGGKVVPQKTKLAPLEPTVKSGELSPQQVELLAKVEARYGKASAEGVKVEMEKQVAKAEPISAKMSAYKQTLLANQEKKYAKQLGMTVDKYREMLAKRSAKLASDE